MTRQLVVACATLMLPLAVAAVVGPAWYKCDPATCKGDCVCASNSPPGGLDLKDTPQFVVLTNSDAITGYSDAVMRMVTDGRMNPDRCTVPTTWFTTQAGTVCSLAKLLADQNNEIATHTTHHTKLDESFSGEYIEELVGVRTFLQDTCNIRSDITGFRAPGFAHSPKLREALAANGFTYDSSIDERIHSGSATSPSPSSRVWPYSMDSGIPQRCDTFEGGICNVTERHPKLMELPVYNFLAPGSTDKEYMAYRTDPQGDVFEIFKSAFDAAYNGNRAPVIINLHPTWFTPERVIALNKFMDYAQSKGSYFVTGRQLTRWMKDPVPLSQISGYFSCKIVGLAKPSTTQCRVYAVTNGETLLDVAGRFGIRDIAGLMAANNMKADADAVLVEGQKLKLTPWNEGCGEGVVVANAPKALTGTMNVAALEQCRTWTIKSGDNVAQIAMDTLTMSDEIIKINSLKTNVALTAGKVLKLPPYPPCCDTKSCNSVVSADVGASMEGFDSFLQMKFRLSGMTQTTWDRVSGNQFLDLVAKQLGMHRNQMALVSTSSKSVTASRRLAQSVAPLAGSTARTPSILEVVLQIPTLDPQALLNQAEQKLSAPNTDSLIVPYGMTLASGPVYTAEQNGQPITLVTTSKPKTAGTGTAAPPLASEEPTKSSEETDSGGFPGWAIGAIVGGVVGLVVVAVGAAFVVHKMKKAKAPAPVQYGSTVGATATLRTGSMAKSAIGSDRLAVVVKGGSNPSTPVRRQQSGRGLPGPFDQV